MTVGRMIQKVRHDKGLKQKELAEIMTVGQSYISGLENNKVLPTPMFIRLFCILFSLDERAFQEGNICPLGTPIHSSEVCAEEERIIILEEKKRRENNN